MIFFKSVLFLLTLSVSLFSCNVSNEFKNCVKGSKNSKTITLNTPNFNKIESTLANNIVITQDDDLKITVTGDDNIIDLLSATVSNKNCKINLATGCYKDYELKIDITMPTLKKVALIGAGDILINDFKDQKGLKLDLIGSGNINLNQFEGAKKLDLKLTGSGNINAKKDISSLKDFDLRLTGSGNINSTNINTQKCSVSIMGIGDCNIGQSTELDCEIMGNGDCNYKGNPIISKNIIGNGSLTKVR